ncbi:MAG: hypothetical protein AB8G15_16595 [Saprospiraceae bacterium]
MRLYFILITFLFLCLALPGKAQPQKANAHPGLKSFTQPDGTDLSFKLIGDANINYRETTDGFTIVKAKDGYYKYARRTWTGNLKASKIIVHNEGQRDQVELDYLQKKEKHLRYKRCALKKKRKQAQSGLQ